MKEYKSLSVRMKVMLEKAKELGWCRVDGAETNSRKIYEVVNW